MEIKKSLAWVLTLVLMLGSLNPVYATDNQLFTDGGSQNQQKTEKEKEATNLFTDREKTVIPDVSASPEESQKTGVLLGDPTDDPWKNATAITELDKEVKITSIYDGYAYYTFYSKVRRFL